MTWSSVDDHTVGIISYISRGSAKFPTESPFLPLDMQTETEVARVSEGIKLRTNSEGKHVHDILSASVSSFAWFLLQIICVEQFNLLTKYPIVANISQMFMSCIFSVTCK